MLLFVVLKKLDLIVKRVNFRKICTKIQNNDLGTPTQTLIHSKSERTLTRNRGSISDFNRLVKLV